MEASIFKFFHVFTHNLGSIYGIFLLATNCRNILEQNDRRILHASKMSPNLLLYDLLLQKVVYNRENKVLRVFIHVIKRCMESIIMRLYNRVCNKMKCKRICYVQEICIIIIEVL